MEVQRVADAIEELIDARVRQGDSDEDFNNSVRSAKRNLEAALAGTPVFKET